MSNSVKYCGLVYDETTNWRALLKDALHGTVYQGLEMDGQFGLSMPDALGAFVGGTAGYADGSPIG